MNKTIEQMWQQAVVEAGKERPFEATWGNVKDKFAELLIECCAEEAFFALPSIAYKDAKYIENKILKLGEPDES